MLTVKSGKMVNIKMWWKRKKDSNCDLHGTRNNSSLHDQ